MPKINACGDIGLKIARDGTWYYQGSQFKRKPLVKLFASVLKLETDGGYYLVTPVEKVPIEVEDAPFVAVEMQAGGQGREQRLSFRTNLDEWVEAGPEHPLSFRAEPDGSFTPFVMIRDGLKAKLARAVYYELAALALGGDEQAGSPVGVWSAGTFFAFPQDAARQDATETG